MAGVAAAFDQFEPGRGEAAVDEAEDPSAAGVVRTKSVNNSMIAMPTRRAALSGAKASICSMRTRRPQRIARSSIGASATTPHARRSADRHETGGRATAPLRWRCRAGAHQHRRFSTGHSRDDRAGSWRGRHRSVGNPSGQGRRTTVLSLTPSRLAIVDQVSLPKVIS
jgi:hypothetical protein